MHEWAIFNKYIFPTFDECQVACESREVGSGLKIGMSRGRVGRKDATPAARFDFRAYRVRVGESWWSVKLSEAIRMNGMMKPQGFGSQSMYSEEAPCALGGALQSIGRQHVTRKVIDPFGNTGEFDLNYWEVDKAWPWSATRIHDHCPVPQCSCQYSDTAALVYHLNDNHNWTRSRIADWVASVEPTEEPGDVRVGTHSEEKIAELSKV